MPLKWQLVTSPYRANGNPPVIPEDFYYCMKSINMILLNIFIKEENTSEKENFKNTYNNIFFDTIFFSYECVF